MLNRALDYLGAGPDDGPLVLPKLASALAFVERQTGRYFGPPEERVEFLPLSQRVWLANEPRAVAGVEVLRPFDDDWQAVPAADYRLEGRALWFRTNPVFRCAGPQRCRVTYTAGYDEPPADIEQIVLDLVALRYHGREHVGVQSRKEGDQSVTYGARELAAIPGAQATLNAWRAYAWTG